MNHASTVDGIMASFAGRTGLSPASSRPRRYLWTDAFAVCNYLGRYIQANDTRQLRTALRLVEQVHTVLGKHRDDDPRRGWISGLNEQEGRSHPTRGGLRIGKGMAERRRDEPFAERLEWERDGQYFHYLVKWMHALDCVARITGESRYALWGLELAKTAHARFVYTLRGGNVKRMYWKMSIDLSYPLVPSMGQHDPLDGLVTYEQLMVNASKFPDLPADLDLEQEIADMRTLCDGVNWVTDDALGIGGLLVDALRLMQLMREVGLAEAGRLASLLEDAETGINAFVHQNSLNHPADHRLAFRELGLCIGLHAVERMRQLAERHPGEHPWPTEPKSRLYNLLRFTPLAESIEHFWQQPSRQASRSWREHRDINEVMLATSLSPDGYLMLR